MMTAGPDATNPPEPGAPCDRRVATARHPVVSCRRDRPDVAAGVECLFSPHRPAGGDAGVYVWNVWHFRHRLLELGESPFLTTEILTVGGPTNLALHNYTVFADLIAVPLQSVASVVTSFNVVYLINVALSGLGMFLLAHRVTGRVAEAWLAGLMFAWAPFLVARGASHFSLVAAAPLPFFLYWLDRAWSHGRGRDAAAAGATVAWAFYCDPYYAVYTAMLFGIYVADRFVACERIEGTSRTRRAVRIINGMVALILVTAAGLAIVRADAVHADVHPGGAAPCPPGPSVARPRVVADRPTTGGPSRHHDSGLGGHPARARVPRPLGDGRKRSTGQRARPLAVERSRRRCARLSDSQPQSRH